MNKDSRIYIAGHSGLLGTALQRRLNFHGYQNLLFRSHDDLDLLNSEAVFDFFADQKPEYVFLAAGKTGGIVANKTYRADFLHTNILIQDNVFEAANKFKVKNLVFYGSSCMYPKLCGQPMRELDLMTGAIEETSEAYAIAKISGVIACKSYNIQHSTSRFVALVPNSMYGPNDDFDPQNSHVLSALLSKFHQAKYRNSSEVELWGSGIPRREFIFSEDVADASIFALKNIDRLNNRHYNIGTGGDYSISELAVLIATVAGFEGKITWDTSKPDGALRKLLDSSSFLSLGWTPSITLDEGLKRTYEWFTDNLHAV